MPRYKLVPLYDRGKVLEFDATNPADTLNVASRHEIAEADLYEEGAYLFTLQQGGDGGGCWVIQTRANKSLVAPVSIHQ